MDSDLSLEFLRVVEQAAIACAHTMGQGDRHKSDHVAVEAMRRVMDTVPIDGTIVIGEGERDEAPMLYIGEKVGLAHARDSSGPRPALPAGRHRRRSARGHEPVRDRRAERHRGARRVRRAAACCTRPTSTWRSWSSGRARRMHVSLDAPVAREPQGDRPLPRPRRRRPGRHRARSPAAREADRRHPRDRRPHPADRRRRSVGRHRRGGGRHRACTR